MRSSCVWGESLRGRKKTTVCTANDLNYCLHQNQTKKNINFLEKRESPKRTFSFYIEKRPPKKRAALYRKISVLKSVSADAAVRLI